LGPRPVLPMWGTGMISPLPELTPRFLGHLKRSLVTVLTELVRTLNNEAVRRIPDLLQDEMSPSQLQHGSSSGCGWRDAPIYGG
jgi:hypothetical protein